MRDSMDPNVGFGFITKEITDFEEAFARYCGTQFAVSLSTASVGLDLTVKCLDLELGDEVVVPAVNFKASALAVLGQGGNVVFCDVDERTFCADPEDVERRITSRTRAILPTHMNGLSADIDALLAVAERHPHPRHGPPKVIGDAARACGGGYKGTKIGKRGWCTVFSFHTMKLMTTLGEGGMVTTDDAALADRLRALRQWGGAGWGSSFKLTKPQAAVGLVQLRRLDAMLARRKALALQRSALLEGVPELTLPLEPPGYDHTFYLYTLLAPREWAGAKRDRLMALLDQDYGVGSVVANPPSYSGHAWLRERTVGQVLPRSEELGGRILCVALHPLMSEELNEYIAAAVTEAVERLRAE
ncbi:MAG: DegT/DnrJ/EryC1/StrS family aminotransferase [Planctomycetes bacterium]|nr:DegT/DnrJ/EryC1/StrS family aminotransferase [Planctomycetota bacterium]